MAITGRSITTLPASDMARAKSWYADKLGLSPKKEVGGNAVYELGGGTVMCLFPSSGHASGDHTQASFEVDDLPGEIAAIKARGAVFEEYDLPGFKTVDSIADDGTTKGAWLRDSEGNLLAITERTPY